MSETEDFPIAVERDEDETPFAMVGDWVMLAPISDRAVRVYGLLRAHINQKRKDNEVWPSQSTLAAVIGLSKSDDIGKSIKELEAIGAVRKRIRTGRKGRYTAYIVRLHAPAGYAGLISTDDLYKPGVLDRLKAERVTRLPHRTQAALAEKRRSEVQDPKSGVTPNRVTPDQRLTSDQGVGITPDQGGELYEGELDERDFQKHTTARERASVDEPFAEVVIDPDSAAAAHLSSRPGSDEEHAPGADVESIHIARQIQRNRRRSDNIVELAKNAYIPESMPIVERFEQRTNRLSLDRKRKWCAAVTKLIKLGYSEEVIDAAMDLCIAEGLGWGLLEDKALIVANRKKAAARASRPQSRSERVRTETESMYERMLAKDAAEAAEQAQLNRATPRAISGGTT
jgi:helix-turn-helix protein